MYANMYNHVMAGVTTKGPLNWVHPTAIASTSRTFGLAAPRGPRPTLVIL